MHGICLLSRKGTTNKHLDGTKRHDGVEQKPHVCLIPQFKQQKRRSHTSDINMLDVCSFVDLSNYTLKFRKFTITTLCIRDNYTNV